MMRSARLWLLPPFTKAVHNCHDLESYSGSDRKPVQLLEGRCNVFPSMPSGDDVGEGDLDMLKIVQVGF